ncbi:MAG: Druantia anti-phage system protein DruA [Eubacteriaceae bacterium]
MSQITKNTLRNKVVSVLEKQGYSINNNIFVLKDDSRETKREAHSIAKAERICKNEQFVLRNIHLIKKYLIDGKNLNINKIEPEIIEVQRGTKYEIIFRWWNLVWWSLPYERAYGRQIRFIIWDKYHNAPIGLIGLQSPILSWSVRDNYIGLKKEERDYWVNQSMSAQRLGALPPYNYILGGKLVASLLTANQIRETFKKKYQKKKTIIKKRKLPPRLLFVTTTGAYGKSSIYNRLKFFKEPISEFIGYTHGNGTFHIPNKLYEDFIGYLSKRNYNVSRGYGNGPSRKLRIINHAMECLGISNGTNHGIKRAVYIFSLAKNLKQVIKNNENPEWINRNVIDITNFWRQRWAIPRVKNRKEYMSFSGGYFIEQTIEEMKRYKKLQG